MVRTRLISLFFCALLWASPALAGATAPPVQPVQTVTELSYEQALALARAQAPTLELARARTTEAQSRVEAAEVWQLNPQIIATAGPRLGADGTDADVSVRATQWLEVGGQRGHRVDAARAQVDASRARGEDAQRLLLREVSLAFVAALYWQQRVEIAEGQVELTSAAEAVARRRHELGDVGGLEESSASLAVAHAQLEVERARAAVDQAEGQLATLLGVTAETELVALGDLRELSIPVGSDDAWVDDRPDLRALEAEARAARASRALGRSLRAPNLAVGLGYVHEESDHVMLGLVGIALPVFDRGQGTVAVAQARGARVSAELEAARNTATLTAKTADAVVQRTTDAARRFEREGLAQLERSEQLVTVGYEKGAVAYDEVLVVRLELVAAKLDYADLLLAAATAQVELAAATGALQ
ncbi:Cobalt-zinc-cadmium resistance protein CzcC precursor [Enhygromyxa salina]|uniref:Cobalt-zinc-cadmium resistance protein CzcC n=1 Tax=Enhygromyxa salina TaxID=215803 RepID=A0A2S9XH73_9BACT|nr:TolC family protein [Enhygromyxa salina]PRP92234.1 Cobalt-zinc-cadmium resistance protein CzcC precursor [Enhygromyxa salina]